MKLLRLQVEGLSLLKGKLDLTFYGTQRINEDDSIVMYQLYDNIYLNCADTLIGKNASGKTTVLQTILLALNILNNEPINHVSSNYVLKDCDSVIFTMFYVIDNSGVYCLQTNIVSAKSTGKPQFIIADEKLLFKPMTTKVTRKTLTDINQYALIKQRNKQEEYLPDDVSMIISQNKKVDYALNISSLMSFSNVDQLDLNRTFSPEIVQFLDPSIEHLYSEKTNKVQLIHLKFKGKSEIILNSPSELEFYLSCGTIKGITVFMLAKEAFKSGGYLLIDEIENHFNKAIVSTLIRLFMDSYFNVKGAVLIYTTHYPELLDEYERNDSIFITENNDGITVTNLANVLKRNDIKKSDVYQASLVADTSPKYDAYIQMKNSMSDYIKG